MQVEQRVKVVEVVALDRDPPVLADAAETVGAVMRRLRDAQAGCALVLHDDRLVGIFTERDVLQRVVGVPGVTGQPVADWMTANPDTVTVNDPIRKALRLMQRGGYRNVPIVDASGRAVGCVRHKDILGYLAEHCPQQVLNLPPDPDQVAETREGG